MRTKLMIAALAAAVAGGAFGAPLVYTYKASVKHMYLKEVKVKVNNINQGFGFNFNGVVYQKYSTTASLSGHLIMDNDAVTSVTIQTALGYQPAQTCADYGRNRGFLVVANSKAEKAVRAPKILPAVLDAKFLDTKFTGTKAKTGPAEGILYVGGDTIAGLRPQIDNLVAQVMDPANDALTARTAAFWTQTLPAASTPGMVAYSDYVWTSIYLFGQYNGPNWYYDKTTFTIPFPGFEYAWDQNLPAVLRRGIDQTTGGIDLNGDQQFNAADLYNYYHDTWMNGTGFGKYFIPGDVTTGDLCCGLDTETTSYFPTLDTLTGNLKGGLFLCTENGIAAKGLPPGTYDFFDYDQHRWEDQFVSYRLVPGSTWATDAWQNDLWQDGAVDQATTDVISGNWTIKYDSKFFLEKTWQAVAESEKEAIIQAQAAQGQTLNEVIPGINLLMGAIKTAGWFANGKKAYNFADGSEIYRKTAANRFKLPMITPQFAQYFGLNAWQ